MKPTRFQTTRWVLILFINDKTKSLTILLILLSSFSHADVAVIVHPDNTVTMDKDYISRIFLKKVKVFPDNTPAVPIAQDETTPISNEFLMAVHNRTLPQLKSYWSRLIFTGKSSPPLVASSEDEVLKLVSENSSMIGYVESSTVNKSVRVVVIFK